MNTLPFRTDTRRSPVSPARRAPTQWQRHQRERVNLVLSTAAALRIAACSRTDPDVVFDRDGATSDQIHALFDEIDRELAVIKLMAAVQFRPELVTFVLVAMGYGRLSAR